MNDRKFDVNPDYLRSNSPEGRPAVTATSSEMFSPISAVSSARLSESKKISRFFKNLNPTEINVLRKAQAKR